MIWSIDLCSPPTMKQSSNKHWLSMYGSLAPTSTGWNMPLEGTPSKTPGLGKRTAGREACLHCHRHSHANARPLCTMIMLMLMTIITIHAYIYDIHAFICSFIPSLISIHSFPFHIMSYQSSQTFTNKCNSSPSCFFLFLFPSLYGF